MGNQFEPHDVFAPQSAGAIQDRTRENLCYSDRAIAAIRKLLLRAIRDVQEGGEAPHVVRDPAVNQFSHLQGARAVIPSSADWTKDWASYVS